MTHPLVVQLRFARSEFVRGLEGVTEEEARRRIEPMNAISWTIGHLAWQEQRYWLTFGQGTTPFPDVQAAFAFGAPASTPPLDEVWESWRTVTTLADPYLDALTAESIQEFSLYNNRQLSECTGTLLLRMTYHYWYHTGESQAVRQLLGHPNLPAFVGDIGGEAPYVPG